MRSNIIDSFMKERGKVRITASIFYKSLYKDDMRSSLVTRENARFIFGEDKEWIAREEISIAYGFSIDRVGAFFQRGLLGAKVDGVINGKSILEIKCVSTDHFHERVRISDAYQLWIGCYCSGIDDGILCYWHPHHGIKRYDTVFPRDWWERNITPIIESMIQHSTKRKRDAIRKMVDKKIVKLFTRVGPSHQFGKMRRRSGGVNPLTRLSRRMIERREKKKERERSECV